MNDDTVLLERYVKEKSEVAFAELVRRQVNFVYAVALRRVGGDTHLAEDVTQQVFTALARQAATLTRHPVLGAWLYTTTRNAAAQTVRTVRRRQAREQEAYSMNDIVSTPAPDWDRLRPVLDDALDDLQDDDRQAVILRFFDGKTFADVGAQLRLSENTARMRVERALDKMHATLAGRGVMSTTAALGAALANHVGVAAPAGLAAAVAGVALTGAGAAAVVTGGGAGAAAATFMSMTKLQIGLAGVAAIASTTGFVVQAQSGAQLRGELDRLRQDSQQAEVLRQENNRLAGVVAEVADLRRDDAELARLRDEAEALRARVQSVARARAANPPAANSVSGPVYDITQIDQIPQVQSRVAPRYPLEMRQAGASGEVVVDFVVDANGEVQNAYATKSTRREFEAAAVAAVNTWTFRPGHKSRLPVNTHMQVPIVFTTEGDPTKVTNKNPAPTPDWF